jgi:hypothetical protein
MLRIQQGSQERYVWPVHLPGWLALGWRVAGSGTTAADPLPQALTTAAAVADPAPEATAERDGSPPAPTRGKRGRRRREEEQSPTAVEVTAGSSGNAAEGSDAEEPAATDPDVVPAAMDLSVEPTASSTASPWHRRCR